MLKNVEKLKAFHIGMLKVINMSVEKLKKYIFTLSTNPPMLSPFSIPEFITPQIFYLHSIGLSRYTLKRKSIEQASIICYNHMGIVYIKIIV